MSLMSLPDELLGIVVSMLDPSSFLDVVMTNKRFHGLCDNIYEMWSDAPLTSHEEADPHSYTKYSTTRDNTRQRVHDASTNNTMNETLHTIYMNLPIMQYHRVISVNDPHEVPISIGSHDMRIYTSSAICRYHTEHIPHYPIFNSIRVNTLTIEVGCIPVPCGLILADVTMIALVFHVPSNETWSSPHMDVEHRIMLRRPARGCTSSIHMDRWTIPCMTNVLCIERMNYPFHMIQGYKRIDLVNVNMRRVEDDIYASFGVVVVYDDHEDHVLSNIGIEGRALSVTFGKDISRWVC